MKKIIMLLTLVTGSVFAINQVSAGQYSIQLEASTAPDLTRYAHLSEYGNLYTVNAGNGFMRTRLGPFANKEVSLDILEKVQAVGHADAFLINYPDNSSNPNAGKRHDIDNFDVRTLKEWKLLTPDQQANLVYLDGDLHVKNGSAFTPLYEVISNNK